MKEKLLVILLAAGLACAAASAPDVPPRIAEISGAPEKITDLEIVVEQPLPVVTFAARELQEFLRKGTGKKFPVVNKISGSRTALVLGNCPSLRKAGIDVEKLPGEGYYIIRRGKQIFLAGRDDAKRSPARNVWQQLYKRGTLSAVYDFLERFAGARFFFAGAGTVIPARGALYLPPKIEIMERPDMSHRNYSPNIPVPGRGQTAWPGYDFRKKDTPHGETLTRVRLRFSEALGQYGHGINQLQLVRRFAKAHPEYFALMPDGRRCITPDIQHTGHICYNSAVREEIYQDAKACLTGKPASSRGLPRWDFHLYGKGLFNVMAQDWLYWCGCEKCAKIAEVGRGKIYSDPKQSQAVSDCIWEFTAGIANRLKKEGVLKGCISNMAYRPYRDVPKCDLPDNVRVMVAVNGLGADPKDTELLRAWSKKTGRRNTVWTYAIGKHGRKALPGVPPMLPRGLGEFIDANKEFIDGGYFESETDVLLFQYLNNYILGKKMWNTSLDTEALLDDHHRVMFGRGAPMMRKFYDELENCWRRKILGHVVETGLGPVAQVPTDHRLWTEIYSPAKMAGFGALFDAALKAAKGDAGAVARINFIRQNLLGPLAAAAERYQKSQRALDSWVVPCPGKVWLRPYSGEVCEVNTCVTVDRDRENFIFTFDCEEPRMADLLAKQTSRDAKETFADSAAEILLNPSGDRKNYFHFVVNANGALTDYRCGGAGKDIAWNSSASAQAVKRADSWSVTVKVPVKDLGRIAPEGFPVNFCRHRALKGRKVREIYYQWSPVSGRRGGFHAIANWGRLLLAPEKVKYLLKADFADGKLPSCWRSGGAEGGQEYGPDTRIFISGGRSLHYKNVEGQRMSAGFKLPAMKPSTRYRLSYFLKTEKLTGRSGAGAFIYFNKSEGRGFPRIQVTGTTPWHRESFEFVTPAKTGEGRPAVLGLWIWNAGGEAWFDDVEIVELGSAAGR